MPVLHTLITGLVFGESPRWHDDRLWCVDMGAGEVIAIDLAGQREVVVRVATDVAAIDPGLVALVTPDGVARQVADGIAFPNGMVVTPDGSTLIVAELRGAKLTAFDIAADGGLSNRRTWAELPGGVPDGICLDAEHAVWYANLAGLRRGDPAAPRGECVRIREGGEVLSRIEVDPLCFACMLGGADGRTLFLMVSAPPDFSHWGLTDAPRTGMVLTVPAPAPGAGWPATHGATPVGR
jgi:sugar lactone lactonase YvrE